MLLEAPPSLLVALKCAADVTCPPLAKALTARFQLRVTPQPDPSFSTTIDTSIDSGLSTLSSPSPASPRSSRNRVDSFLDCVALTSLGRLAIVIALSPHSPHSRSDLVMLPAATQAAPTIEMKEVIDHAEAPDSQVPNQAVFCVCPAILAARSHFFAALFRGPWV